MTPKLKDLADDYETAFDAYAAILNEEGEGGSEQRGAAGEVARMPEATDR